jgi:hypothetical protein
MKAKNHYDSKPSQNVHFVEVKTWGFIRSH